MCILAHPDDESLATGGILAKYAAEGVATYLVCATRGERGWHGDPASYPGPAALGHIREAELRAAAKMLRLREVHLLGYSDGELDQAPAPEVIGALVSHLRRVRPQVVVTFDPLGYYGHPDHIAISQHTTAALVAAAAPDHPSTLPPHSVAKLYYIAASEQAVAAYQAALGDLVMRVDGVERRAAGWRSWALTTSVDTSAYWHRVWSAVACHRTQLPGYDALRQLPPAHHRALWGTQTFYRAMSLVNGGRDLEEDLFCGLPEPAQMRSAA